MHLFKKCTHAWREMTWLWNVILKIRVLSFGCVLNNISGIYHAVYVESSFIANENTVAHFLKMLKEQYTYSYNIPTASHYHCPSTRVFSLICDRHENYNLHWWSFDKDQCDFFKKHPWVFSHLIDIFSSVHFVLVLPKLCSFLFEIMT